MVRRWSDRQVARDRAYGLLEQLGRESAEHLPIDAIAHRLGVQLVEAHLDRVKAQLVVGRHGARILLSDKPAEPEDRTWSIAHELGHYVCEHTAPPVSEICVPRLSGCLHDRPDEDAADAFASVLLMPPKIVAAFCDRTPMTIEIPMQLAETCGVTFEAAAMRITESSWQVCALVFSQHGRIKWIAPSLPFLMLCGNRIRPGRQVGPVSLVRRFLDTGICPDDPELVPTSAWVAGCGAEAQLLEHSVANPEHKVVMTILWDPTSADSPRPATASLQVAAASRDQLLDKLNEEAGSTHRNEA